MEPFIKDINGYENASSHERSSKPESRGSGYSILSHGSRGSLSSTGKPKNIHSTSNFSDGSWHSFDSRDEDQKQQFIFPSFGLYSFNVDRLEFIEKLGEGAFGEVWKAYYQGELFAVKILKDNNNNNMFTTYQKISSEIACALPHINVVRHYSLCSKNYQEFFLIMEYVPRGALASLLRTSKWVSVDHEFN
jgi:hypothetical protein